MLNGLLVYNPYAGRYPSWLLSERAANVLRRHGWQIDMRQSQQAMDITNFARQASDSGMDALFVVGGDGTINLAIRGLLGGETALGVLPAGTGNVFAQELGLPGLTWTRIMALEESARLLSSADVHRVDVGLCGSNPFLLWAGIGLDAFIIRRIEPRPRWEKHFAAMGYAASSIWNAVSWHGINMQINVDGSQINGHFLMALASNAHLYAGGIARLSSQARLDDGKLDLWLFEGDTLGDAVQCAWDIFADRYTQTGSVRQFDFQSLVIETDHELYIQVDGEPIDYDKKRVEITVLRKALKILIPENPPWQLFEEK